MRARTHAHAPAETRHTGAGSTKEYAIGTGAFTTVTEAMHAEKSCSSTRSQIKYADL